MNSIFVVVLISFLSSHKYIHATVLNNNNNKGSNYDVVIVGAGLTGLSACRKLTIHNISCIVLEASGRVGGRTRNWDTRTGEYDTISNDVVEIGGTFISPSHTSLISLGKTLGFNTYNVSIVE